MFPLFVNFKLLGSFCCANRHCVISFFIYSLIAPHKCPLPRRQQSSESLRQAKASPAQLERKKRNKLDFSSSAHTHEHINILKRKMNEFSRKFE